MRNIENITKRIEQLEAERSEIFCDLRIAFRTKRIEKLTKELRELEEQLKSAIEA